MLPIVNSLLNSRKKRWNINSISRLDFSDASQIIRTHILRKFHLWNQDFPFEPWASRIISNQLKNIIRDNYTNYARPCLKCPFNIASDTCGNELCHITKSGIQCEECPLFATWVMRKKTAHELNVPASIHIDGELHIKDNSFDFEKHYEVLIKSLKEKLPLKKFQIFEMSYLQNYSDEEIANKFNYSSSRQVKNIRKEIYELAKQITHDEIF